MSDGGILFLNFWNFTAIFIFDFGDHPFNQPK